jgi:uncharacterized UBP type Zn finger protein
MPTCAHLDRLYDADPPSGEKVCPACVAVGGTWVHLRKCESCGNVGCCDQSPNRHARAHFQATRHPVMRSLEGREQWAWCYVDLVEYDPAEDWDREGADLG